MQCFTKNVERKWYQTLMYSDLSDLQCKICYRTTVFIVHLTDSIINYIHLKKKVQELSLGNSTFNITPSSILVIITVRFISLRTRSD